jgi:hypothetical protein
MPVPIEHKWVVLNRMASVATSSGAASAIEMTYKHGTKLSTYRLVPGYGMASFIDSTNTSYQVCAARVCDSSGACTGASSCANLVCSQ